MKINIEPLQKRLHELLDYNSDTGIFVWKPRYDIPANGRWNGRWVGKNAGCVKSGRYKCIEISIDLQKYMASRLAWIYVNGNVLNNEIQIDHKDCNPLNNRISNLRAATHGQNTQNRSKNKNKELPKGISFQKNGSYRARITNKKQMVYLGTYDTLEEAKYFHNYASQYYHGEFARSA